jgi:seryl-tRNA synthetase
MAPSLSDAMKKEIIETVKATIANSHAEIMTALNGFRKEQAEVITKIEEVAETCKALERAANDQDRRMEALEAENSKLKTDMEEVKELNATTTAALKSITEEVIKIDRWGRSWNIRVLGIPEVDGEDPVSTATKVLDKVGLPGIHLDTAHRVPGGKNGGPRPMLVRLAQKSDRYAVFKNKKRFYDINLALHEDLPAADRAVKAKDQEDMNRLYREGRKPRFVAGAWFVDGKRWAGGK